MSEDPVIRFIELLCSAISGGRAHIADAYTNAAPIDAESWGWQLEQPGMAATISNPLDKFRPKGDKIGWIPNDNELWLDAEAAYAVVQKIATDQKTAITTSKNTLWKQLNERKLLITPTNEPRLKMKKVIAGHRREVLVLRNKNILFDGVSQDSEVPVPTTGVELENNNVTKKIENYADKLVGGIGNKTGTGREAEDET